MKIAVVGLWHLGLITASCLAQSGHEVTAFDPHEQTIVDLNNGISPIYEPGLDELLAQGREDTTLKFTNSVDDLNACSVVWITFDTPVDSNDVADIDYVMQQTVMLFPYLNDHALILISAQLPVGSTKKLTEQAQILWPNKKFTFAYLPENLRLGKAIKVFTQPDRIIVGLDDLEFKSTILELLQSYTTNIIFMSVISAEMTKHAINSFLAVSVTFINELASICETVGADARDVERGLKSEERIGPRAYLKPGGAISGGTLLRDINYLIDVSHREKRQTFLLSAILESNQYHKQWSCRRVLDLLKEIRGKKIAMLGLTYKANTDTLRRSPAIEMCEWLHAEGCEITAFDPSMSELPEELGSFIQLKSNPLDTLTDADCAVISTEWAQFKELSADDFVAHIKTPLVLDPSGFTANNLGSDARIKYYSVGDPA